MAYGENPKTGKGALMIILTGVGGALFALVIAQLVPSIIPARATGVVL